MKKINMPARLIISESDLPNLEQFDLVYCRGNSLVYAASWEQNWVVPKRSEEEIFEAVSNFYKILREKGKLYIDITKHNEIPHKKTV